MDNEKIIEEHKVLIKSTYDSYLVKPTLSKLHGMLRQTLLLGIELGLKRAHMNMSTKGNK